MKKIYEIIILLVLVSFNYAHALTQPKSTTILKFADANTLFVADSEAGKIFAYEIANTDVQADPAAFNIKGFGKLIETTLDVDRERITYHDITIHPQTGEAWVSLSILYNNHRSPAIIRVNQQGEIHHVDLTKLNNTVKILENTPEDGVTFWRDIPAASLSITDLDYVDGMLYVSGLSSGEFASILRQIPYPFQQENDTTDTTDTTHIEIYHTVHNQTETRAPIRAMQVIDLEGKKTVLAAYTCTPLVTIAVEDLKPQAHVKGKTIAELGYGNTPLDIIVFEALNEEKQSESYVLVVHKERNADLIRLSDIISANNKEGLSKPIMWGQAGVETRSLPLAGVIAVADQDPQFIATLKRNITNGDVDLVSYRKGAYFRLNDFISEYNFPDYEYSSDQEYFRGFQNLLKTDEGYPDLVREVLSEEQTSEEQSESMKEDEDDQASE